MCGTTEKTYQFAGTATVSVSCKVKATSEREARAMIKKGDCEWVCDEVDGAVTKLELLTVREG